VDDYVAVGAASGGAAVEAVIKLGVGAAALAGVMGCSSSAPTAPLAAAAPRFSTVEGVHLAATLSPSVVTVGDSTVVTLSLTNPSGSEITVGLAESGYRAFVVQIGRASALTPLNRGSSPGYVWSGTADPEVPVPARASIVEAIGALHIGAVLPSGSSAPTYALDPGDYVVRACVVQPGPIESCAAAQPLTVVR
jgi:hypothetical protein